MEELSYQEILDSLDNIENLRKYKVHPSNVVFDNDKNFHVIPSNRDYMYAIVFRDSFVAYYKLNYYKTSTLGVTRVKDTPYIKKMKLDLGNDYLLKLTRLPPRDITYKGNKFSFCNAKIVLNSDKLETLAVTYC